MTGDVNELPVPSKLPPDEALYQLMLPVAEVALTVAVFNPHNDAGVVELTVGKSNPVAVTCVLRLSQPLRTADTYRRVVVAAGVTVA